VVKELFRDILKSMNSNRQRIWLTGLATCWGIFILIVLLGTGNGIARGVTKSYLKECDNVISVSPGVTSLGYGSFIKNRRIVFNFEDAGRIQELMPEIIELNFPEIYLVSRLNYGDEYCDRTVCGEKPGYCCTLDQHIEVGRDLSAVDEAKGRKVCVISKNTAKLLFGSSKKAIGKIVKINEVGFKIVGVYATNRTYVINNDVYAPFGTLKELFVHKDELDNICFKIKGIHTDEENKVFTKNLRSAIAQMKNCSPQDMKAFKITNVFSDHLVLQQAVDGVKFFIWFIGIATLISGIVGISNIMSITVKERTREFGVLRAMGAGSRYILSLVLIEAVIIALIFGYIGLIMGIGVTQLLARAVSSLEESADNILSNPTIGLGLVAVVTLIIIFSGLAAGFIPARRAMKMKLIDALNDTI